MKKNKYKLTPQEARSLWKQELRSGNKRQAAGSLAIRLYKQKKVKYCCLGVACELFNKLEKRIKTKNNHKQIVYDGQVSVLPDCVKDWLGVLGDARVQCVYPDVIKRTDLVYLNDCKRLSFNLIADVIEESERAGIYEN